MELQELRLGNIITDIDRDENEFTREFDLTELERKHDWTPVPLTEEWLRKFGFERFPWGLVKGNLLFRDDLKNPCETLTLEIGNGFRTEIKYVHQLQNLYYALTNEELTVL